MKYFVTGATGFIGRHLVERLLDARGHDLRARARGLARAARGAAVRAGAPSEGRIVPVIGDLGAPLLGVSRRTARRSKASTTSSTSRPIYDMSADEETNRRANVDGHPHAIELANALRRRALPPHQLDRGGRQYRGAVPRGHVRRGAEARRPVPAHQVRVREARARAGRGAAGASTGPASSSATRRPARWTRSTGPTTSSS